MIREYEKLSKKWRKIVKRYGTLNYIWLHYENEGTEDSENNAMNYFREMMGIEFVADTLGYDLHELLRSYEKWLETHVEKE